MDKPRGRLIILCGLPGTGKTTLAIELAERHNGMRCSADDWMEALSIDLWESDTRDAIEALQWQQAQYVLTLGGTVIIEWGSWGRSERDALREGARKLGAAVELIYLDAPLDTLLERVNRRGRENPPIDRKMLEDSDAAFQRPTPDEFALFDPTAQVPS